MSTNIIGFHGETRRIFIRVPVLSRTLFPTSRANDVSLYLEKKIASKCFFGFFFF